MIRIKLFILAAFAVAAFVLLLLCRCFDNTVAARPDVPLPVLTGAPGENTCAACHFIPVPTVGQFSIAAPPSYVPGQAYQIVVRHATSDPTRLRWGFQLTALAGSTRAGTPSDTTPFTSTVDGGNNRDYTGQTAAGTFAGQQSGALWTFKWIAPATNVGAVNFYAAGVQANNDSSPDGDTVFTTSTASQPTVNHAFADFDGDGRGDISVYRPAPGIWYLLQSTAGFAAVPFGISTDAIVPGDYDGDGRADVAVFRNGIWYLQRSQLGFVGVGFGTTGDVPVPADFDGDGTSEIAVFRSGTWYIYNLVNGNFTAAAFGTSGDIPTPSDYDADGRADIAVFRPSNGTWYLLQSTVGFAAIPFGTSGDKPVAGDYDGDGKADVAVFRAGNWYLQRSQLGFAGIVFGHPTDLPAPADFDGDRKFEIAVYRSGTWYALNVTTGAFNAVPFGTAGDRHVPNAFIP